MTLDSSDIISGKEMRLSLDTLKKDFESVKMMVASQSEKPVSNVSEIMLTNINETIDKLSRQVYNLEEKAHKVPDIQSMSIIFTHCYNNCRIIM